MVKALLACLVGLGIYLVAARPFLNWTGMWTPPIWLAYLLASLALLLAAVRLRRWTGWALSVLLFATSSYFAGAFRWLGHADVVRQLPTLFIWSLPRLFFVAALVTLLAPAPRKSGLAMGVALFAALTAVSWDIRYVFVGITVRNGSYDDTGIMLGAQTAVALLAGAASLAIWSGRRSNQDVKLTEESSVG